MNCSASSNPAFLRQPAQLLIIEAVPPWWSETCTVICDALENFLTLVCSLGGPCQLPLLSIYAVTSQQKCLLPLVTVEGNLPRLLSCVGMLRSIPSEGITVELARAGQMLREAVLESVECFQQRLRFFKTGIQGDSTTCIEVTVVTSRPGLGLVYLLENVLKDDNLRPVIIIRVERLRIDKKFSLDVLPPEDPKWACSSVPLAERRVPVDLVEVENNVFAVEEIFKEWLRKYTGPTEHIRVVLESERSSPNPVYLKCDMRERLISPSLLALNFTEKPESLCDVVSVSQVPRIWRPIKVLYTSGLCQSLLYGLPLVIYPTSSFKLDFNETEINQQMFQALNHTLRHHGQVLLLQEVPTDMAKGWLSLCILQPCPSFNMLLKPVVCQELLLPCPFPEPMRETSSDALLFIKSFLSQMDEEDVLIPSSLSTNLYQYLRTVLVPKTQCYSSASSIHPATHSDQPQQPEGGEATASVQPHQLKTPPNTHTPRLRPPPVLRRRRLVALLKRMSLDNNDRAAPPADRHGSDENTNTGRH
ncbi:meiosis 1 arrest protein isoform X2 [Syngnathoides biaculeatus]|uniref:meiosis 1 arrest protein isoform X2 n=1 Tax=Syngnathoides biaculeatus TaxID=300417 RepID=UPI002ADDD07B|nr:meiosis 1 arrest protein isoform X2 [Syngnathoides biaculeatus]